MIPIDLEDHTIKLTPQKNQKFVTFLRNVQQYGSVMSIQEEYFAIEKNNLRNNLMHTMLEYTK